MEIKFIGTRAEIEEQIGEFLGGETSAPAGKASKAAVKEKASAKEKPAKFTLETVKTKTLEFTGRGATQKGSVKELLGEFNVTRVTDLEAAEYGDYLEKLQGLVDEDDDV